MGEISNQDAITTANLQKRISASWHELEAFIDGLSEAQLTELTDAGGWTVKDHLAHLAIWESGLHALLAKQPVREAMDVEREIWKQVDDAINAVIQKRYQQLPLAESLTLLRQKHEQTVMMINAMEDSDLTRPYSDFQPKSDSQAPIIEWIAGMGFGHYGDHLPWMRAIVENT